ncbi:hypothetical protein SOVF_193190 [Spinacia oleracea]|nr:hypothetical protein SOVF_193190 [Spinacia oleracea]
MLIMYWVFSAVSGLLCFSMGIKCRKWSSFGGNRPGLELKDFTMQQQRLAHMRF